LGDRRVTSPWRAYWGGRGAVTHATSGLPRGRAAQDPDNHPIACSNAEKRPATRLGDAGARMPRRSVTTTIDRVLVTFVHAAPTVNPLAGAASITPSPQGEVTRGSRRSRRPPTARPQQLHGQAFPTPSLPHLRGTFPQRWFSRDTPTGRSCRNRARGPRPSGTRTTPCTERGSTRFAPGANCYV
jgi:hypothetical protein